MLLDKMEDDLENLPIIVRTHEDKNVIQESANWGVLRYDILIRRHLLDNETKFKSFFRVSRDQFFYLMNFIQSKATSKSTQRTGTRDL
jgi:hypothetical protein